MFEQEIARVKNSAKENLPDNKSETKTERKETAGKFEIKKDKYGKEYWYIEDTKDLFRNTPKNLLAKTAYDWIISARDNDVKIKTVDGIEIGYIRDSANEYVFGELAEDLKKVGEEKYKDKYKLFNKKMRLAPSFSDLVNMATVKYHTPDHEGTHKLFKDRGFDNYRGRVRIDNIIFNYVVRVGKASFGDVFYDIKLEVDQSLPDSNGTSEIKKMSTSNDIRLSQDNQNVKPSDEKTSGNNKDMQNEGKYSLKEAGKTSSIDFKPDIEDYPYNMQTVIKDYLEYSNEGIRNFVERVKNGEATAKERLYIDSPTQRAIKDIKLITGIDVTEFKTAIEPRMIEHIIERHGENGKADSSMANVADIERMQYVINNFDDLTYGGKSSAYSTVKSNGKHGNADTVVYSKKINGTYYVVEAVPNTSQKTLFIVTACINKKEGGTQVSDAKSPVETSETPTVDSPSDKRLSQTEENVKKYSLKDRKAAEQELFKADKAEKEKFASQVDKWMRGEMKSSDIFELGRTPVALKEIGARELPVTMSQDVIVKITGGKHNIAIDDIKQITDAIADPIMVFKSASVNNAFVILTELIDKSGNDVVVALHLSRSEKHIFVNRVSSLYGKNNIVNFVTNQINDKKLLYANIEKSLLWSQSRGLQLPKLADTTNGSNNIILTKENIVNKYFNQNAGRYSLKGVDTLGEFNKLTEQDRALKAKIDTKDRLIMDRRDDLFKNKNKFYY